MGRTSLPTLFDPDKSVVHPLNEKINFIWKHHFFPVLYNPIFMFLSVLIFPSSFFELEAAF